jgi:hypothetical protein
VSWFDKIVDAIHAAAVIGERVERLSRSVAELAVEMRDLDRRLARLEGAAAARTTPPQGSLPPPRQQPH